MKIKLLLILLLLTSSNIYAQEVVIRDAVTTGNKANITKVGTKYGVNNDPLPATTIFTNQVTVSSAGTRVQLSGSSTPIRSICVKALTGNSGNMYVGDVTVSSSNGYELPKDVSVCLDVNNINLVYIDASSSGDKISYLGIN